MARKQPLKKPLTICVGSLKGGGGKSNVTTNLAVAFQSLGMAPAIIDADQVMNTSVQWSDDREEHAATRRGSKTARIHTVKKTGRLAATIQEMSKTYPVVIVDTGGQMSTEMHSSLVVVDMLLTPVEPTQEALDGMAPLMEIVDQARNFNEQLTTVAVLSRVPPNSPKRVAAAREYLESFEDLVVADAFIANRVSYPDTKSDGLSVIEGADSAAKTEIEALVAEIITIAQKEH